MSLIVVILEGLNMAEFNQYSMYSYTAGDFKSATDGKILVDLKKLSSFKKYDEILNFISTTFGEFDTKKEIEYPNDIKVMLQKHGDLIIVAATQKDKQIFGTAWEPVKEE